MSDDQDFEENMPPADDDGNPKGSSDDGADATRDFENELPKKIGRFEVVRELGHGGFGVVYLANDPELKREVALKVPHEEFAQHEEFNVRFREEGQLLARIKHSGVVTVFDVGMHAGLPFVVMEYVEGAGLNQVLKTETVPHSRVVEILIEIAEALRETHKVDIIHRDLKPGNVIVGVDGHIKVVDFGLALHDDSLARDGNRVMGTRRFMAPEQIRGENHRVHGQTDIWAFGVTMYRMLTGKFPFDSDSDTEIFQSICYRDPRPLRQRNDTIDWELERICLKCLAKLIPDRYQSMADLLDDLIAFQRGATVRPIRPSSQDRVEDSRPSESKPSVSTLEHSSPVAIVPKGLRSFDGNDAEFFLELLPGPKDRYGLPESIRFWKSRTEINNELEKFSVGLIFGPSGCGKSSFVRAGLIPRLDKNVIPIYVECTSDQTEQQIVDQLTFHFSDIDPDSDLATILLDIRCGRVLHSGDRLLIVLDQFEQWLSQRNDFDNEILVNALRQCDGQRAQAILLCRDDFYLSTSQFMRWLEIPIQDGVNAMALPLFDKRHARKVLEAFGRANKDLPPIEDGPLGKPHSQFIKQAVELLAIRNRVICVQLSVMAEMMRQREWTNQELKRLGGIEGVGVRYLDEIFNGAEVPNHLSTYEAPSRAILTALLPSTLATIKGVSKTREELIDSVSAEVSRIQFEEVFQFLEEKSGLVSPVEMPRQDEDSEAMEPGFEGEMGSERSSHKSKNRVPRRYHLTHDFLVNPIREWTQQKEKETWRGRARIRFEELATQWNETKDDKFLPSMLEYGTQLVSKPDSRNRSRNIQFWRKATRKFLTRISALSFIVIASVIGFVYVNNSFQQTRIELMVSDALDCRPDAFPVLVEQLTPHRKRVAKALEKIPIENDRQRLHKLLLQLQFGIGDEESDDFANIILSSELYECENVVAALENAGNKEQMLEALGNSFAKPDLEIESKCKLAIISLFLGREKLATNLVKTPALGDPTRRSTFVDIFSSFHPNLRRIQGLGKADVDLVYSLTCAILSIPRNELSNDESRHLEIWSKTNFKESGDAGVHAASGGLVQKLTSSKNELFWTSANLDDKTKPSAIFVHPSGNWAEYEFGISLCKVGESYVSAQEIDRRLFNRFCEDQYFLSRNRIDPSKTQISPTMDHPAQNMSGRQAILFCNWLSRELDRQPCYTRDKNGNWTIDISQNGFRLPEKQEFLKMSKADALTQYHFGGNAVSRLIPHYACSIVTPFSDGKPKTLPCGSLLPTRTGLFDILGNVSEWSWKTGEDVSQIDQPYFSSCFQTAPNALQPTITFPKWSPYSSLAKIGIRVVTNSIDGESAAAH